MSSKIFKGYYTRRVIRSTSTGPSYHVKWGAPGASIVTYIYLARLSVAKLDNRMNRSTSPTRPPRPTSTQAELLPTVEEINKQFVDAQDAQDEIFERSRRQQRITFLSSIDTHDLGGDRRDKEFSEFIKAVNRTYMENRAKRNGTFDVSEEKRDALFESQDRTRQHAFDEAQGLRERISQQTREQCLHVTAEITHQCQELFTKGRERRQQMHDDVEVLFALFDALKEAEEVAFIEAQDQRDAEIDQIMKARGHKYPPLSPRDHTNRRAAGPMPQTKRRALPTLSPVSTFTAPLPCSSPDHLYSVLPHSSVDGHEVPLLSPYSRANTCSTPSIPEDQPPLNAHTDLDGAVREYVSECDKAYNEQEVRRAETFSSDMAAYRNGFLRAASHNRTIQTSRQTVLAQMNTTFREMYQDDQERQIQFFRQKMSLQNSKEDHRQSQFSVSQQSLKVSFYEDRTAVLKQFSINDEGE
ncbi:hypothetical protein EIP91_003056 [Steccherinum ochraceum]|uniref:Uncharacterized protein n=1 Tax=Steccherinum ochraceum TaxID=92696 RepID=A0A4R0RHA5_9APHY|nr:hypothetical protein EIP91_003056 [Steccherinum ochraceum]